MLALAVGKRDPSGQDRLMEQDRGKALASASTLNRLEMSPAAGAEPDRYEKIIADHAGMYNLLVDCFVEAHAQAPEAIWLDLDATDDPLHGEQEGRFCHGDYDCYCYFPLYIFTGEHALCARLHTADQDARSGSVEELTRIVARIRARWPHTRIIVRGDSGFCREEIMAWCEANAVDFVPADGARWAVQTPGQSTAAQPEVQARLDVVALRGRQLLETPAHVLSNG